MTKGTEYEHYRALYIENLKNQEFPWRAAYYYYINNTDDFNKKSFAEYKESISLKSMGATDEYLEVSEPIYLNLDQYYNPVMLLTADNQLVKLL